METLTLEELCQALKQRVDEISLLEVLSISAEDLVERFKDRIEERYDQLSRDFDDEEED
jgi:ribosome assembly protein YihI (activator of Der GTPase)